MITPTIKDKILFYIQNNFPLEELGYIETKKLLIDTETSFDMFRPVLYQFERLGFLKEVGVGQENTCFIVLFELHDFAYKGGFAIQEEIFKANIEKLGFEIDNLRKQLAPDQLDTLTKLSSIASALFAAVGLVPK